MGERRLRKVVSRRAGSWAGEKNDCFNILLTIQRFASVTKEIIVGREGFVSRVGRIDFNNVEFFLVPGRAMQNRSAWSDNFAVSNIRQLVFSTSRFAACP